ncbi:hypothetical protein DL768_008302 [Monosporascus sp. mg162]|nr:hypothetical protein DL768_008302 [Monosporascus sp. mg162]
MAEAVAALGLAASVLQFLDCGSRFVSQAWRIYKTGADGMEDVPNLQLMVQQLQEALADLQKNHTAGDSPGLAQLSEGCSRVARRLLESIDCLSIPQKGKKRHALKTAFMMAWKRDEIKALQQELDGFRNQLSLQLLTSLRQIASRSADEKEAVLRMLGAKTQELGRQIDMAASKQEAIGMSMLNFLTTNMSSAARGTYRDSLLQDLLLNIYQDRGVEAPAEIRDTAPTLSARCRWELEQKFLARLRFTGMEEREVQITEAYERTLQWVFKDPPEGYNRTWSNFRHFLESDTDNLYWITGKAGSGKSTLMKFIAYEPDLDLTVGTKPARTTKPSGLGPTTLSYQYLSRWAGEARLFTATFYFWNSGVRMLTTQAGLFRSILYQLLSQEPLLIRQVAASRWEALCFFGEDPKDMGESELRNMLMAAVRHLSRKGKVCLFIDGLDEFESDKTPARLIELVSELAKDVNSIKLCVASRPWLDFEDAFKERPKLRMENLTHQDIIHYVSSKLCSDPSFESLQSQHPDFAGELAGTIVQRSCGVFLWVHLVVTSLLEGMRSGDRVRDLHKRLDQLPERLEDLYEKILLSLDPMFLEDTARYFSIVRHSAEPVSILLLSYMDEDCPRYVLSQPIASLSEVDTQLRTDTMRKRLNHRSKGLLEVQQLPNMLAHATVQYLHRTVKDYIESDDAQKITKFAVGSSYDHNLSFCAGYLSLIKSLSKSRLWKAEFPWLVHQCLASAMATMPSSKDELLAVLDELDRTGIALAKEVVTNQVASGQFCEEVRLLLASGVWVLADGPTFEPAKLNYASLLLPAAFGRTFLSLAVKFGLADYVAAKANHGCLVQRAAIYTDKKISFGHKPNVRHAVWPLLLDAVLAVDVDPNMVNVLLTAGADPNFKVHGNPDHTPWVKAVEWAILRYRGYFSGTTSSRLSPYEKEASLVSVNITVDSGFQESFYDSAWLQTDWVQRSWAALYEGEWSHTEKIVFRKPDPNFLRKPPCRPVIRDMIDHGAAAKDIGNLGPVFPVWARTPYG